MYKLCFFVFLSFFGNILCLEIGSPCFDKNVTGVCKKITDCQVAIVMVRDQQIKPPMCYFEEDLRIVCCPNDNNLIYRFRDYTKYFGGNNEGVLTSQNMTCRDDGQKNFLCCRNLPNPPSVSEPTQCPPLPSPKLNADPHFTWEKCLEYQRYCNVCVKGKGNSYKRINKCGFSIPRIVDGIDASPMDFPQVAALGCHNTVDPKDKDIIWIGGGTLISERYILTAAHAIMDNKYGLIRYALLGTTNKTDIKSGLLCNIIRTIPYKEYETGRKKHDIALVLLHERVRFNEFILPACLPVPGRKVEKTNRIVAGWGVTESGQTSDILRTTTVSVVDDPQYCAMKFDDYSPETMICVKGNVVNTNKRSDTCQGDSGGPLLAKFTNYNSSYCLEGVVSFGPNCGKGASVYTDVSKYLDWIIGHVWPNEVK